MGASQCPNCLRRPLSLHETETVLGVSVVGLAILFAITGFAVSLYHSKYQALGGSGACGEKPISTRGRR
jgi:hypothetical protein